MDAKNCPHPNFAATVAVNRFEDTGRFMADIRVSCTECGEPFRFLGVQAGIAWDRPTASIDGVELHAPIEPEIETRLMATARFHMPPAPAPRH